MRPILLNFPESFETNRLVIRSPLPGDGPAVMDAIQESLPSLRPWMPWARIEPNLDDIEENVRVARANFILRTDLRMHVYDKSSGRFLGGTGLHRLHWEGPRFEIGYWLRSSAMGRGIMTETVTALSAFAYEHFRVSRLEIRCDTRNVRSRRVAERSGFRLEAILRDDDRSLTGELRDTCIFARVWSTTTNTETEGV